MIDAKELRIGNWVQSRDRDNDGSIVRVESIDDTGINYFISTAGYEHAYFYEPTKDKDWFWIEPIPLTTEILEKCGFEWYEPLKHWRLVDIEQWYSIREMKFDNLKEKSLVFSWTNLAWDEGQSMPYVIIETVHQLQNLFYALNRKELEIKL